jgi:hypothetical protein
MIIIVIVYLAIGAYVMESVNIYADKKGIQLDHKDRLFLGFLWLPLSLMSVARMVGKGKRHE